MIKTWQLRSCALALCAAIIALAGGEASAQSNALFVPLPQNQLDGATPQQSAFLQTLRTSPTTATLQLARVNLAALRDGSFSIPLPDDGSVQATWRRTVSRSASDYSWFGDLPATGGTAILVVQNGDITGSIRNGRALYTVTPLGDGVHALIKLDRSRFPPEHPDVLPRAPDRGGAAPPAARPDAAADPIQVDYFVAYTHFVLLLQPNIVARIQLSVDETNQAYIDSNANVVLRLVGTMETAYDEGGKTFAEVLDDVTQGVGPLAQVHAQREATKADLVSLVVNKNTFCGMAWLNADAPLAFSVLHYDCTGSGNYTMAHELGHNFGALHDPITQPPTNSDPFPYGHGYVHPANAFVTIMGYATACNFCPRIGHFSNPNVLYQGNPTGTETVSNVARVHNERVASVAAFRDDGSPATTLLAAILPYSRSVQVGTAATAFAAVINTGTTQGTNCTIQLPAAVPGTFQFRAVTPSNTIDPAFGNNQPVSIAAGATRNFVFGITPTLPFDATDIELVFRCTNAPPVTSKAGLNTFLLSASSSPVPDLVSIGVTPSGDGIVNIPGTNGAGFFAASAINIGVGASITAVPDAGGVSLPLVLTVCQTTPQGVCLSPASSSTTTTIPNNGITTYTVFVQGTGDVPFDPANSRLFLRFNDSGGVTRGATTVAVRTQPADQVAADRPQR